MIEEYIAMIGAFAVASLFSSFIVYIRLKAIGKRMELLESRLYMRAKW